MGTGVSKSSIPALSYFQVGGMKHDQELYAALQPFSMVNILMLMGCLLLGPPGFNCWFSFAPVFQWCCSTPQGSPGDGRNTFLSSPHLCFIKVFICDLFVSRDDPLMS